jgi:hypothetical protein
MCERIVVKGTSIFQIWFDFCSKMLIFESMTRLILNTILFFMCFHVMGQQFVIEPAIPLEITVMNSEEQTKEFYIQNTSHSEVELGWEVLQNTFPSDWDFSLCDNRICYNTVPSQAIMEPIEEQSFGFLKLAVWNTSKGIGELSIRVFTVNQDESDTLKFIVRHIDKPKTISLAEIRVYPNPVEQNQTVFFDNPKNQIKQIRVFNSFGQQIELLIPTIGEVGEVHLNKQQSGIYFLQFLGVNENILFTRRISVK